MIKEKENEINNKILEKDNEIKILKSKLSRFPFELNEDEILMSIIFTSSDQNFYHSIICKNTEKFNTLENKLYDMYSEYSESGNYFLVNGREIKKAETLEQNKINNNDIIVLNIIE